MIQSTRRFFPWLSHVPVVKEALHSHAGSLIDGVLAFLARAVYPTQARLSLYLLWCLLASCPAILAAADYDLNTPPYVAGVYEYGPYNQKKMDPQLTGYPIRDGVGDALLNWCAKPEYQRWPGYEPSADPSLAYSQRHFIHTTPCAQDSGVINALGQVTAENPWVVNSHGDLVTKVVRPHVAGPAKGNVDILLVGDSITAQWCGMGPETPISLNQYPQVFNAGWTKRFAKYSTLNIGIGGDRAQSVLWRLDHGGVEGLDPRLIILCIGHNNIGLGGEVRPEVLVRGTWACVLNLRYKFPRAKILVVKVLPSGANNPVNGKYSGAKAMNASLDLLHLDRDPNVHILADMWDDWIDSVNLNGNVRPELFRTKQGDQIHPSQGAGYDFYAMHLEKKVFELLGDAPVAPSFLTDLPAITSVVEGSTATFSVVTGGPLGRTYQWQKAPADKLEFADIPGATSSSFTTPSALTTAQVGERYRVLVQGQGMGATSRISTISILPAPALTFTRNAVDTVVKDGSVATFSVAVSSGTPSTTFQWQSAPRDSDIFIAIAGANAQTSALSVTATMADHGTKYRVVATRGTSSATSQIATLQVVPTGWKYELNPGFTAKVHTASDGLSLGYFLYSPTIADAPATGHPLVVVLPGKDTDGKPLLNLAAARFVAEQSSRRCHVMIPVCPYGKDWTAGTGPFQATQTTEMRLLRSALDALVAGPPTIDLNRVYLIGFHAGGYAAWDLLQREGSRWAAAVPVMGGGDSGTIASSNNLPPIWAAHSWENNALVPVVRTREMVTALESAGKTILYSEYNRILSSYVDFCGDDPASNVTGQPFLTDWMFAQVRSQTARAFLDVAGPKELPPWNLCPGKADGGPITSYSAFYTQWKQKRDGWATAKSINQGKIVFLGDSITDLWSDVGAYFPRLNGDIVNMGLSGDMTRGVLTRIQDVIDVNPRAVSLLIGTNDLTFYGPNTEAICDIAVNNIKATIQALRTSRADMPIVVSTIMPTGFARQDVMNAKLKSALSGMPKVFLCDVNARYSRDGYAAKGYYKDGLHPTAAGYAAWAEELDTVFTSAGLYGPSQTTYAITYDANGATVGTAPPAQTKTQGTALILAQNSGNLGKTGFTFAGWNTKADGTGMTYAVGTSYAADAALILFARWTALPTYSVTYDANGATVGTAPPAQTKTQGTALILAQNSGNLGKAGSTFIGWNTKADGSGISFNPGVTYAEEQPLTLFASWIPLMEAFVTRFYRQCLNRDPDVAGLANWTNGLRAGRLTGVDVAQGFLLSPEFLRRDLDDSAYVDVLYRAFFDREPDLDGKAGWLGNLRGKVLREDVLFGFIFSAEFSNLCQRFGITVSSPENQRTYLIRQFVRRFYQNCLEREPDGVGIASWTSGLVDGNLLGADVARGFIQSQEMINRRTDDLQYVAILYRAFFDRMGDPAGTAYWVSLLRNGGSRPTVLEGFIHAQEFIDLCGRFGIISFPTSG